MNWTTKWKCLDFGCWRRSGRLRTSNRAGREKNQQSQRERVNGSWYFGFTRSLRFTRWRERPVIPQTEVRDRATKNRDNVREKNRQMRLMHQQPHQDEAP